MSVAVVTRVIVVVLQTRFVFLITGKNIDLGCANAAALNARNFEPQVEIACAVQCRDCIVQELRRQAGIYQSGEQHVAADAGEAIEISDAHGERSGAARNA
jgi:hypothetical protein